MADQNPYAKYPVNPYAKYGLTPVGPADDLHPLKVQDAQIGVRKGEQELTDAPTMHAIHAQQLEQERLKTQAAREAWQQQHPQVDPRAATLTGPAFLNSLPQAKAATVKALLTGRMQFPSGPALKAPYWQDMLAAAAQADPEFDAVNYNARAKTRADFTSGKNAQNIKALNTAIGHLGHMASQIDGTASHGGDGSFLPFAQTVNHLENAYSRSRGASGVTNYDQTIGALSGELTAVYRGAGGAEADIKRYIDQLSPDMSRDQKMGAVKNIVGLLNSRLDAINDQYQKGMGTTADPLQVLDPKARQIVAAFNGGGDAGNPPSGGVTPPPGPIAPATGPLKTDADKTALLEHLMRSAVPYGKAMGILSAAGVNDWKGDPKQYADLVAFGQAHPDYKGSLAEVQVPTTLANQFMDGRVGTFAANAVNTAAGGIPAALAGQQGQLGLQANSAANPWSAGLGKAAGFIGGSVGLGRGLQALGATRGAALGANAIEGYSNGATENPDSPVAGGAMGLGAVGAGELGGRYVAAPILRGIAGTKPVAAALDFLSQKAGRGGFNPVAALPAADRMTVNGVGDDLPAIAGKLQQAQALNLPYALADASPKLRALAGSAVRKNPEVLALADSTLPARHAGQGERALGLIDQHLAPAGDIGNLVENARAQAQTAASPLYEASYGVPARTNPQLEGYLNTPSAKGAMARARTIALDEQRDPNAMGFTLDQEGNTALTQSPSWQTLDYLKRGLDDRLAANRSSNMGRLDEAGRATEGVRSGMLGQMDALNPLYGKARGTYRDIVGQGSSAQLGFDSATPRVTPAQLSNAMGTLRRTSSVTGQPLDYTPNFQQGYASNMADRIVAQGRGNPYDLVNGSMGQKAKLNTVFPNGADQFHAAHALEGDMARTYQEALGGSATQPRAEADKQFENGGVAGHALDLGVSLATGQPNIGMAMNFLRNTVPDAIRLRAVGNAAAEKAAKIGPALLNTDPGQSLAALNALMKQKAEREAYVKMFGQAGGTVGSTLGASSLFGLSQGQ